MQILFFLVILSYLLSSIGYWTFLFFQRDGMQKIAMVLLLIGFGCHSAVLTWSIVARGHMPVNNLHETLSMVAWSLVAVYLLLHLKLQVKILGVYVTPLAAFVMLAASQFPGHLLQPPNLLKGFWPAAHIVTIFVGEAAFALACGLGILYLLQERSIKTKTRGFIFKRLPSLELLDSTGYACIATGFTMLTIGLITGMVFAKSVWGRFWSWDPKEVWSGITWLFYAALLHERITVGWRGRRSAIMAIIGFGVLLFTFLGVNFLLEGHHGEFTK